MKNSDISKIEIELLIQAIFAKYQYDFKEYSRASLLRRLEQAKIRFNIKTISEIQHKVLHEKDFFPKLIPYLTVNTTEFFRDPLYYQSLRTNVFPFLKTFPSLKIWVAGCSTGEEVISLSILLREASINKFLIYATDINPLNLEKAKKGIYSKDLISKAEENYKLSGGMSSFADYYDLAYESVKFKDALYKNIIFSDHSLATDSVFSETHFVSCRNVLIYFNRPLQERAYSLFSESLVRGGFLGLGNRETIQFSNLKNYFSSIDLDNRVFQKTL